MLSDIKNCEKDKPPHKIPNKLSYINNFDICLYTISPIIVNGVKFEAITLDFEGILLRIKRG